MPAAAKTSTKSRPDGAAGAKAPAGEVTGTKIGVVDSDKRAKTRRVVVSYFAQHTKYKKFLRRRTILHVHDDRNESRLGDVVEVVQCRPISKTKRWKLVRVVERRAELTAAMASVKEVQ